MSFDVETAVYELQKLGWSLKEPPSPQLPNVCFRCDKTDEHDYLIDVTVEIAKNEEGYSNELRWACDDHLVEVSEQLVEMGFSSHYHGSIVYLEDMVCLGSENPDACPTPSAGPYDT